VNLPTASKFKYWLHCDGPFWLPSHREQSARAKAASEAGTADHAQLEKADGDSEQLDAGLRMAERSLLDALGEAPQASVRLGGMREVGLAWDLADDAVVVAESRGLLGYPPRGPGDLRVRGTIDFAGMASGRLVVVDYKTGDPEYALRPVQLEQMLLLGWMAGRVERMELPPIIGICQTAIARTWLDELPDWVDGLVRAWRCHALAIQAGEEEMRLSSDIELCRFCDCRSSCPKWSYNGEGSGSW